MWPSFLWRWGQGARARRPDLHVVLFTRRGCHLCDEARAVLRQAQRRFDFPLETRDVDASADLVARFGSSVPVVTVNGKVRFRGRVNRVLLERLLECQPSSLTDAPGEE